MNQDEFEQTVMQELRELESKHPEPLSKEWFNRFRVLGHQLKETQGEIKCQAK